MVEPFVGEVLLRRQRQLDGKSLASGHVLHWWDKFDQWFGFSFLESGFGNSCQLRLVASEIDCAARHLHILVGEETLHGFVRYHLPSSINKNYFA